MTQRGQLGMGQVCLLTVLGGLLWVVAPNSAGAEVMVTGTLKEATIQTTDATFEELLSKLHDQLDITFKSSAPLDQKVMDGTFVGPLTKILAPLLKGYDHVIKVQDGRISVILTDQKKSLVKLPPAAPAAVSTSAASEPTTSGADKSAKNEVVPDTKKQSPVTPTDPSSSFAPSSSSPAPSPFAVTTSLETQLSPFMNQAAATAKAPTQPGAANSDPSLQPQQPSQVVPQQTFAAQQAAIAQTMQRANIALQSLVGSLNRLPASSK
jgi:hypothetical protein